MTVDDALGRTGRPRSIVNICRVLRAQRYLQVCIRQIGGELVDIEHHSTAICQLPNKSLIVAIRDD